MRPVESRVWQAEQLRITRSDVTGMPGGGSGFSEPTWARTLDIVTDQATTWMRTALATGCFRGVTRAKAAIRYTT